MDNFEFAVDAQRRVEADAAGERDKGWQFQRRRRAFRALIRSRESLEADLLEAEVKNPRSSEEGKYIESPFGLLDD